MNLNRSSINYVWAQVSKNAPVSIGHWSLINIRVHGINKHSGRHPKEWTVRYFNSSVGAPEALYYYHFQQSPFVSGSSQSIHHSVIQFSHEVYYAMRESMLWTWVDTWIWRDFITQLGNCNSITNQPQRSYKWEC
jgi:hypothetical protein